MSVSLGVSVTVAGENGVWVALAVESAAESGRVRHLHLLLLPFPLGHFSPSRHIIKVSYADTARNLHIDDTTSQDSMTETI